MILSGQSIRERGIFTPFSERTVFNGMSYGLSYAGYDIRIQEDIWLEPKAFTLASSMEHFDMPNDLLAQVTDKSSWARQGLSVFNTIIEPGWSGYLTLELVNHNEFELRMQAGDPIAQIILSQIDRPVDKPYAGKYQNQPNHPVCSIKEMAND